jgi:DNA repair photolyase
MIIKPMYARTILSKSKVMDYSLNPYVGCEHGCTYCYARFIKRFTGHRERWGSFVDVKINAPTLLHREMKKKVPGKVWISGVCDPYQPLEKKYELTRQCLQILLKHKWPVTVQTKSSLILRDLRLLTQFNELEVGLSITTANEQIRELFEPKATPINQRIETLAKLHKEGIQTFAMIAPLLPKAEELVHQITGKVDYVLMDKMNYHYADNIYRKHRLEYAMSIAFFKRKTEKLAKALNKRDIPYQILF